MTQISADAQPLTPVTEDEQKAISYDLLCKFDAFCRQHSLTCFLAYGTLLGAVRHKGFIPWDDDVDVAMPRADYERFVALSTAEVGFKTFNPNVNKNYYYNYTKVSDTHTLMIENGLRRIDGLGVNLDVFPIDELPSDAEKASKFMKRVRSYGRFWALAAYECVAKSGNKAKYFVKKVLSVFCKALGANYFARRIDALSRKYNGTNSENAGYVATSYKKFFSASLFQSTSEIKFEDRLFFAPSDVDLYLKTVYRDYMTPPPVEKRTKTHDSQAYKLSN